MFGFKAWSPTPDYYEVQGTAENLIKFSKCTNSLNSFKKEAIFVYVVRPKLELLLNYSSENYENSVFIFDGWKEYNFWGVNRNLYGQVTSSMIKNTGNNAVNRP